MEFHRSYVESYIRRKRRLISPIGITLIDADRNVLGEVIYQVDSDVGVPVIYDEAEKDFYELWRESRDPIKGRVLEGYGLWKSIYLCSPEKGDEDRLMPCYLRDCACNAPLVNVIPYARAQNRSRLARMGEDLPEHWACSKEKVTLPLEVISHARFTGRSLSKQSISISRMNDPGRRWKDTWAPDSFRDNLFFPQKHDNTFSGGDEDKEAKSLTLLDMPLEVFEALVKYLDGKSLLNLSQMPEMEKKILEPYDYMQPRKKIRTWYNVCTRDLNRSTLIKIWSSFHTKIRRRVDAGDTIEDLSWEQLFQSYTNYWGMLVNGSVKVESLHSFENRLKGEIAIVPKEILTPDDEGYVKPKRIIGTCGGRMLYNVLFPPPSEGQALNMTVVEDFREVDCRHASNICTKATSLHHTTFLTVKVVLFPEPISEHQDGIPSKPSRVDQVLVGACYKCITIIPLQGGVTRRFLMNAPTHDLKDTQLSMQPIMEVQDNIVALWLHPEYLIIFLVIRNTRETARAYDMYTLYRLWAPQMQMIWKTVAQYPTDFLPAIREYKGNTDMHSRETREMLLGGSSYIYPPTEPTYYGLALISPIYGIECIKPNESAPFDDQMNRPGTVVESISPQHYLINGRKYIPSFRQWSCSAKGHGLFVFCADKVLAVSSNGVEWLFGEIEFPEGVERENEIRNVIHVEIIYDNGLLLVVNENILLIKLTLLNQPPVFCGEKCKQNMAEPKLMIQTLRVFPMKFNPLMMELTHVELNFDEGKPFLFIITEKKRKEVQLTASSGEEMWKWAWDDLSFKIKRIDFF